MARWDLPHVIQSQVVCACHGFWTVASFFLVNRERCGHIGILMMFPGDTDS